MTTLQANEHIERGTSDYWDGLVDENTAANFICQSIRTLQKWRVTGFGPVHYKSGRSLAS